MNVKIDRSLSHAEHGLLAQFAMECGSDRFTLMPCDEACAELLEPFCLGKQQLTDYTHPKHFSTKQVAWQVSVDSLAVLNHVLEREIGEARTLTFYRGQLALCVVRRTEVNLSLWDEQRDHLFRMGFDLALIKLDGTFRRFDARELSENKGPRALPRINLTDLFKTPYGIESRRPARMVPDVDLGVLNDHHIWLWWTDDHDAVIREQIRRDGYAWWPSVSGILRIADGELVGRWKRSDPLCLKLNWRDLLIGFARARASQLDLERETSLLNHSRCSCCGGAFAVSETETRVRLQSPYFNRVPAFMAICDPCISRGYSASNENSSREEMKDFAFTMCEILGRIPSLEFGQSTKDYEALESGRVPLLLRTLRQRPAKHRVEREFGSWLQLLIESGVLAGEVRRTARGTQCVAKDGHVCLSIGEKVIDDLLFELGIPHKKEAKYPGTNLRSDFFVNGTYVEYFGLTGAALYDIKTEKKRQLCKSSGWKLLEIFPQDLLTPHKLRESLALLAITETASER